MDNVIHTVREKGYSGILITGHSEALCPRNTDQDLKRICFEKAHEIYGEQLPLEVKEHLEKEVYGIRESGYSYIYMTWRDIACRARENGYPALARGAAGASLVVYLLGISLFNPLKAHYRCKKCKYSDFDHSGFGEDTLGMVGIDLKSKSCPVCGSKLLKDGFDLSVETFMGPDYLKEPNIEMNIAEDEKQRLGHYISLIPGMTDAFEKGSVSFLDKESMLKYVNEYYSDDKKLSPESDYMAIIRILESMITVFIPKYHQKFSFLKGKNVQLIKRICDRTHKDILDFLFEDSKVKALSTEFQGMDIKPDSMTSLIKLSGFKHGVNVWTEYIKELVKTGRIRLHDCIGSSDDLMQYLLGKGIDNGLAYQIMRSVHMGKGLSVDMENRLKEKHISEWYIKSCNKISYLFPKAHNTAMALSAYILTYFKTYYPREYEDVIRG